MKHNEIELEDWKDFAKSFPLYEQLRNKTIGITGQSSIVTSRAVRQRRTSWLTSRRQRMPSSAAP